MKGNFYFSLKYDTLNKCDDFISVEIFVEIAQVS